MFPGAKPRTVTQRLIMRGNKTDCFLRGQLLSRKKTAKKWFALRRLTVVFKEHELITCESRVYVVVVPLVS